MSLTQEQDLRARVQDEFHALVENLFSCTFRLRRRFDLYRYAQVRARVTLGGPRRECR